MASSKVSVCLQSINEAYCDAAVVSLEYMQKQAKKFPDREIVVFQAFSQGITRPNHRHLRHWVLSQTAASGRSDLRWFEGGKGKQAQCPWRVPLWAFFFFFGDAAFSRGFIQALKQLALIGVPFHLAVFKILAVQAGAGRGHNKKKGQFQPCHVEAAMFYFLDHPAVDEEELDCLPDFKIAVEKKDEVGDVEVGELALRLHKAEPNVGLAVSGEDLEEEEEGVEEAGDGTKEEEEEDDDDDGGEDEEGEEDDEEAIGSGADADDEVTVQMSKLVDSLDLDDEVSE